MLGKVLKYMPGYKELITGLFLMSAGLLPLVGAVELGINYGDKISWFPIKPLPEIACLCLIALGFWVACVNDKLAQLIRIQVKKGFRFYRSRVKDVKIGELQGGKNGQQD